MSDIITITGTIGTEPDFKRKDGLAITSFRLASTHRYRDNETNSWVEGETSWYSVSIFRVLAENAFASLHKGERVIVTGKLRVREWETSVKKGITAQIEADSIGHDLLFGTSQFAKGRSASANSTGHTVRPEPAPGEDWPSSEQKSDDVENVPEDERELALLGGETPF